MAKKRMPILGITDMLRYILAYNLAKYQNFSMILKLFAHYYQITYSIQFSVQYHIKWGFYPKKTFKKAQKCHFLNSRFFESARYVLSFNLGYDKSLSEFFFRGFKMKFRRYKKSRTFELGLQNFMAEIPQNFCRNFAKIFWRPNSKIPLSKYLRNFLL